MSIDIQEAMWLLHLLEIFIILTSFISKAIRDMAPIIDPEEDYLTIVAAEDRFALSEAKRKNELDEALANFRGSSSILPSMAFKRDIIPW